MKLVRLLVIFSILLVRASFAELCENAAPVALTYNNTCVKISGTGAVTNTQAGQGCKLDDDVVAQVYKSTNSRYCARVSVGSVTGTGILAPYNTNGEIDSLFNNPPTNVTTSNCYCHSPYLAHGAVGFTSTTYTTNAPVGATCASVDCYSQRTCNNGCYGAWTPAQCAFSSCNDGCAAGCCGISDSPNAAHGGTSSVTRYSTNLPNGVPCSSVDQSRTISCSAGTWSFSSGSYTFQTCNDGCPTNQASVNSQSPSGRHGDTSSVTRYSSATPSGVPCTSVDQSRGISCSNGTWSYTSGSYTNTTCTDGCASGSGGIAGSPAGSHGGTSSVTRYASSAPVGTSCSSQSRSILCSSGSWGYTSGSYTATSCNNGCPSGGANVGSGAPAAAHGGTSSVTRYSSSTPNGVPCTSVDETRNISCSNGTWSYTSGSYTNATCTDGCAAGSGGIAGSPTGSHGGTSSVTRYASSAPVGTSCSSQSRSIQCSSGSWGYTSGSYTATSCNNGCAAGAGVAGTPSGSHGQTSSVTRYASSAPVGSSCVSQSRGVQCSNGTWVYTSGSYTATSCSSGCTSPSVAHGGTDSRTRYLSSAPVGTGCTSESQSRTCSNGTWGSWSGSYTATSCNAGCTSPSVAHGGTDSRTRYLASAPVGTSCTSEGQSRTCSNGSWGGWSGSYTATSCNNGCPAGSGISDAPAGSHGQTSSVTRYLDDDPPTSCTSQSRSIQCSSGTWGYTSGSYTYTSCTVTPTCSGEGQIASSSGDCCAGTPNYCSFDSGGDKITCPGGEVCYCTAMACPGGFATDGEICEVGKINATTTTSVTSYGCNECDVDAGAGQFGCDGGTFSVCGLGYTASCSQQGNAACSGSCSDY